MEARGKLKVALAMDKNDAPYRILTLDESPIKYYAFSKEQHDWGQCAQTYAEIDGLLGRNVTIVFDKPEEGKSRKVTSVAEATGLDSGGGNGDAMSNNYQAMKDRRICRVAIAKSIIGAIGAIPTPASEPMEHIPLYAGLLRYADLWFNWVYEQGAAQESVQSATEPDEDFDTLGSVQKGITKEGNGSPVSRSTVITRLQRYIKNQPDSGPRLKTLEGVGEHEKLNDYSDKELVIMYTAMREEQEAI